MLSLNRKGEEDKEGKRRDAFRASVSDKEGKATHRYVVIRLRRRTFDRCSRGKGVGVVRET